MPRQLRALIQLVIMGIIIAILNHFGHLLMRNVVAGLACVVLVGGLFVPPLFLALEAFGQWLGKVVAVTLTWGLLTPFFYLVFTPGRFLFALRGKDPLNRTFPTKDETYWIPRPAIKDMNQYTKQH